MAVRFVVTYCRRVVGAGAKAVCPTIVQFAATNGAGGGVMTMVASSS